MSDNPITPAQARSPFVPGPNDPDHDELELLIVQINEALAGTQISQGGETPRVSLPVAQHSDAVRASIIAAYQSVGWTVELITDGNSVDYLEFRA